MEKNFLGRRSILLYLLALMPIVPLALLAVLTPPGREWQDFTQYNMIFAIYLRRAHSAHRGVLRLRLDLHEPVSRRHHRSQSAFSIFLVRGASRSAGGWKISFGIGHLDHSFHRHHRRLDAAALLSRTFHSESSRFFFDGPGLGQLLTYAGITILACIGYGAFFLVVGLFFRNPIIPAIVLYGWEWLNFLLPPLLKKISVIHYLNSLGAGAGF